MAVAAYVCDGGLLGLMPLEPATGEPRHRKSHAALSAMAVADDQLWLLTAGEIPGNGGLYTNREGQGGGAALHWWHWAGHTHAEQLVTSCCCPKAVQSLPRGGRVC